jgi:hypothetical protein
MQLPAWGRCHSCCFAEAVGRSCCLWPQRGQFGFLVLLSTLQQLGRYSRLLMAISQAQHTCDSHSQGQLPEATGAASC